MPADLDKGFYEMLDSIAETDDAVQQNKKIKEAQFAEDSREPNEEEIEAIRKELKEEKEDQGRTGRLLLTAMACNL